jgi:hypothetical protein
MNRSIRLSALIVFLVLCCETESAPPGQGELIPLWLLPGELPEASGMIEYNGLLWLINDGDRGPWVYGLDPSTGLVMRKVFVNGANIDWEEITQDENNIYIGDFGNNSGSRKDLKILICSKADFANDTVRPAGIINFSYSDQQDFTSKNENTSFDCEAFLVYRQTVLLFSKDWITKKTTVYSMPSQPGTYSAMPGNVFATGGLVTGAAFKNGRLVLIGYNPDTYYSPFLFIADDFNFSTKTYGNRVRIDFPSSTFTQAESVIITSNDEIRIATETNPLSFARLFAVKY